jgi:ribose transport system permease protein
MFTDRNIRFGGVILKKSVTAKIRLFFSTFERYGPLIFLVVFSLVVGLLNPRFLSIDNFKNLSQQIVPMGIVALGLTFIIIAGDIDLSAGWGVSLIATVVGVLFGIYNNVLIALIPALLCGLMLGLINGLLVTKLGIPPFVTTLATMSIAQGLTYAVSTGRYIFVQHPFFVALGRGTILGVPINFLLLIVVYAIGYMILNNTKLGVYTYAIGGNEEGARMAGINIGKWKMILYIMSGICMTLAAIITIARISLVTPNIGGSSLLLDSVAAVILGGTSMSGGKGTLQGTFIGVVLMGAIGNTLNLLNVPAVYQDVFKGLVIILALYLEKGISLVKIKEVPHQ